MITFAIAILEQFLALLLIISCILLIIFTARMKRETALAIKERDELRMELNVLLVIRDISAKVRDRTDFLRLLEQAEMLPSNKAMNLDDIFTLINPRANDSKTDYYALRGGNADLSDDEIGSAGLSESRTQRQNDFSKFRRWNSDFSVKRWGPDDRALCDIVCEILFGGSEEVLEQFIQKATKLRSSCFKLLSYTNTYNELFAQNIFLMFLINIFVDLKEFEALPINISVPLSADINLCTAIYDDGSREWEARRLTGRADVGIYVRDDLHTHKKKTKSSGMRPIEVVCELKANLQRPKAYHQKDQLLIEMEALRQLQKRPFIKGLLTDLVALNIAVLDNRDTASPTFFVAKRVCDHRAYIVRLLFLLCDISHTSDKWNQILVEVPVSVPASALVPEHNYHLRSSKRNRLHKLSPSQQRQWNPAKGSQKVNRRSGGRKRGARLLWEDKDDSVIYFKEEEEMLEYEEECRSSLIMALRMQGYNYLCAENLQTNS